MRHKTAEQHTMNTYLYATIIDGKFHIDLGDGETMVADRLDAVARARAATKLGVEYTSIVLHLIA